MIVLVIAVKSARYDIAVRNSLGKVRIARDYRGVRCICDSPIANNVHHLNNPRRVKDDTDWSGGRVPVLLGREHTHEMPYSGRLRWGIRRAAILRIV